MTAPTVALNRAHPGGSSKSVHRLVSLASRIWNNAGLASPDAGVEAPSSKDAAALLQLADQYELTQPSFAADLRAVAQMADDLASDSRSPLR